MSEKNIKMQYCKVLNTALGTIKFLSGKIITNKVKVKHADPKNIDTPCFSQIH